MPERRPPSFDEIDYLYRSVGMSVWLLQHLEDVLSHSMAIIVDFEHVRFGSVSQDEANKILSERRRMTLGQAVARAKEKSTYSEKLLDELGEVLSLRNWLIHRLVFEADTINLHAERDLFFKRIADVGTRAQAAAKRVLSETEESLRSRGADIGALRRQASEDLRNRHGRRGV